MRFVNSKEHCVLMPEGIVDIKENRLIKGMALAVKDGLIDELLPSEQVSHPILLPGLTLMPGLVDCHVHFALDSVDFNNSLTRWQEPGQIAKQIDEIAGNLLKSGVLAVRDGGDRGCIGFVARNQVKNGLIVRASGWDIRRKNMYGSFLGSGVDTVGEAKEQIKQLVDLGVDQIKLILSGIVSFSRYGKVGPVQFNINELKEIVDTCHSLGKKVMAHASSGEAVVLAAEAGVDSVEHGYFISDRSLELMGEKGIGWVPTIIPVAAQTEDPYRENHGSEGLSVIEKTYRLQMEQVKKAASWGILLGVGTDAGAIGAGHGSSYFRELELYEKAGLSPQDILQAAVIGGAKIIGLDEKWGQIEPGSPAYLIAVKGNPLEDLSALKDIQMIALPQK